MTPILPPKLGEKPYLEKDLILFIMPLFGHSLFRVLLHWIHGDNVKGNYNANFLEAIDFAFKKCHFTFVPKAEQLQAIHAVVTGNDGFVKPETNWQVCLLHGSSFNMFAIFFDPSPRLIVNQLS